MEYPLFVAITGPSSLVDIIKAAVRSTGVIPVDDRTISLAQLTIELHDITGEAVVFDSVDSDHERELFKHIRVLAGQVTTQDAGGNRQTDKVVIGVPSSPQVSTAVVQGIVRALSNTQPDAKMIAQKLVADELPELLSRVPHLAGQVIRMALSFVWKMIKARLGLAVIVLALAATPTFAQTSEVTIVQGGNSAVVTAAGEIQVNCTTGCSSGGTQDVNIIKYLGTAMSATNPIHVTPGTGAVWAVTGTFWQATQPVSGTVTVNQGTAAGLAAGWPVIIGNANQQTATWDSSTALNTAVSAGTINNYSTLIITARTTTTITAGQMTFQCSDDGSNWFNVQAVRTDSATVDTVYSFVASTNQAWLLYTGAWARCRALVSQQITGTGAATITFTPSAASGTAMTVSQPAAGTTQTISGAVTATVTDVATATNQTGGSQKTQIVDGSGNVAGQTANAVDVNIKSGSIANTGFNVNNTVSTTPADGDAGLPTRVVPEVRSSTGTLGALNARVSIAVTGMSSIGGRIDAGTCTCTLSFKISSDGGATYGTGAVVGPLGTQITSLTVSNPNAAAAFEFFPGAQITNVAVDVTSYTSGSTTGTLRASPGVSALSLGLANGLAGSASPLYATQIAGTDGVSLRPLQMKNSANAGTEYAAIVQLSSLGNTVQVNGNVATTIADGANVTLGAKADAKSTATDTTAVTAMSVLKEISAMEQAPASRAVTNAGTFAVQAAATIADGADSTRCKSRREEHCHGYDRSQRDVGPEGNQRNGAGTCVQSRNECGHLRCPGHAAS
jgi:hypothetical protein